MLSAKENISSKVFPYQITEAYNSLLILTLRIMRKTLWYLKNQIRDLGDSTKVSFYFLFPYRNFFVFQIEFHLHSVHTLPL